MSPARLIAFVGIVLCLTGGTLGQELGKSSTKAEVAELLRQEPIADATWPAWRDRLNGWLLDRSSGPDDAFAAARIYLVGRATPNGELPAAFAQDALAYYLLGNGFLYGKGDDTYRRAEQAYRKSIAINPKIANVHRNLARVLVMRERSGRQKNQQRVPESPALLEAARELDTAKALTPNLPALKIAQAELAEARGRFADAELLVRDEMLDDPEHAPDLACILARMILVNRSQQQPGDAIKSLVDRFPDYGPLRCFYAIGLTMQGQPRDAVAELKQARALGIDPDEILSAEVVKSIESAAAPRWYEHMMWIAAAFAAFYAIVMAAMALAGLFLAGRTRGSGALQLLGNAAEEFVSSGQVIRTHQETQLARFYMLALMTGLVLFYVAIPFVVAGLLGGTLGALYLVFMLPRIPIKLIVIVVVIGGGLAWAVLKSIFASPGRGSFGILKTSEDCPKLYAAINDVARRIDTQPVHELYLAPGSSIGVHQEGRGPFGVFGVKSRVLTLGMSTMHFLTVSELQSILAHEYAHFSHSDTFYSRFIYQVQLSIDQALSGMGAAGGKLNYVNPFFWFLYLYYKSYSLLSAGFSRSREFLADRMAVSLYGSDVFVSALKKVATDGSLFEMTMYEHMQELLAEDKALVNMYAAFRDLRDQGIKPESREELYDKILQEHGSVFASHPTFKERVEAVETLPRAQKADATSALQLFDDAEAIEKELTDFMTGFMSYMHQLQAAAAQE